MHFRAFVFQVKNKLIVPWGSDGSSTLAVLRFAQQNFNWPAGTSRLIRIWIIQIPGQFEVTWKNTPICPVLIHLLLFVRTKQEVSVLGPTEEPACFE